MSDMGKQELPFDDAAAVADVPAGARRADSAPDASAAQAFVSGGAPAAEAAMGVDVSMGSDAADTTFAVEACGFSFRYPKGEDPAIMPAGIGPIDWRVREGDFQLLVGATGSGKTTLLRCLKPAIAPEGARAGRLEIFGQPVDSLDAAETAGLVGYVSQSPENQIVCDTVWHELAFGLENLGTPQEQMRRRVAEVAHFFGIEPWFRRRVDELSGGQKQMVTLAGVLAMQPRLLLLDEPTAQLDPVAQKNFLHALFRVNRELGVTVVVATHAPEACAEYATSAVELAGGRVAPVPLDRFAARPLVVPARKGRAAAGGAGTEGAAAGDAMGAAGASADAAVPAAKGAAQESRRGSSRTRRARVGDADAAISIRDAYVRYGRDDDWVLRGLDLDVRRGAIHAVVGGNGCGKSTLLRLAAGVMKPSRGRAENRLASRQALLPQDPKALFVCDSVDEELREWQGACGYADEDVARTAAELGLDGCLSQHPYDLSGGQQQLLAFAKLALTDPDLLLLDEPTKGLDAAAKLSLARAVAGRSCAGVTVLMATHDLSFAALVADEVTMLFDGEAACTEPAAAFFANNLFYRPTEDAFARAWLSQDSAAGEGDAPGAGAPAGEGDMPGAGAPAGEGVA